jgi:hypothetical protein
MRGIFLVAAVLAIIWGCGHNSSRQQVAQLDQHQAQPSAAPASAAGNSAAQPVSDAPSSSESAQQAKPAGASPATAQSDHGQAKSRRPGPISDGPGSEPTATPAPAPASPVVIPAGQSFRVRMEQTIDTKRNRPGDHFQASLVTPIVISGKTVVPKDTLFSGQVTEAKPSGRLKGRAILGVELDSFTINNVTYPVITAADTRAGGRHRKRNWLIIGGGSGLGTTIGAIAGGPAGALIGAGAGAAAGTTGAFFTGRKNVSLPVETVLTFRLRRKVEVQQGERAESQH